MSALASAPRAHAAARPSLRVDLGAIAENTRLFTDRAAGDVMAVVKADGFGHGALAVATTALASGASWLGVTAIEEGLALRRGGVRAPMLSWLNPVDADFAAASAADVDVAVPSLEHLASVVAAGGSARVHLHVDCGRARRAVSSTARAASGSSST